MVRESWIRRLPVMMISSTHLGWPYSSGWSGIIRSIKVEIADVLSGASFILIMSSPEDRERKLNRLGRLFRRDLDVEIRREKANLRNSLTQDFEREIALTETCVNQDDFSGALYHRMMADMAHRILKDLEME